LQVGATDVKAYGGWGYQYQWWVPTGSTGDYLAVGIWGQYIYINPKSNVVIVKSSSGSWTMTQKDDDEAVALFRAISKAVE
jgi:CubicO group peptidase (beta-lactamase class C family)